MALGSVAQLSLLCVTGLIWLLMPVTAGNWSYKDGKTGPDEWPGMCKTGTKQSPINLDPETALPGHFEPLVLLNYDRKFFTNITNNGHTVQLTMEQPCDIVMVAGGLPGVYHMDQFHFHWKAEHTLRGKRLPLELHIVHHNRKYSTLSEAVKHHHGIAVLGVLFYRSDVPNKDLTPILDSLSKISRADGKVYTIPHRVELEDLLPDKFDSFYRYSGSLTTPNCDESVIWTVLTDLVPIGEEQIEQFYQIESSHHEELKSNYRPLQKVNNRHIYLQHPRDLSNELSRSSRLNLSWLLVLLCGLLALPS